MSSRSSPDESGGVDLGSLVSSIQEMGRGLSTPSPNRVNAAQSLNGNNGVEPQEQPQESPDLQRYTSLYDNSAWDGEYTPTADMQSLVSMLQEINRAQSTPSPDNMNTSRASNRNNGEQSQEQPQESPNLQSYLSYDDQTHGSYDSAAVSPALTPSPFRRATNGTTHFIISSNPFAGREVTDTEFTTTANDSPNSVITQPETNRATVSSASDDGQHNQNPLTPVTLAKAVTPTASDESEAFKSAQSCCICLEVPEMSELSSLSGCDHIFCFGCIEKWADRENTCPLCKVRFTKISRIHKISIPAEQKEGEGSSEQQLKHTSKKVSNRNQYTDDDQGNIFVSTFFMRLDRKIHEIQTLVEHYCNNERKIRALIEKSRDVQREIETTKQDDLYTRMLHLIQNYFQTKNEIVTLISRSHHIERIIIENHIQNYDFDSTSVDIFFNRLESERRALTEHFSSNEREIKNLYLEDDSIEELFHQVRTKENEGISFEDVLDCCRNTETEIYTLLECSCNIESEIEAFIDFIDDSMRVELIDSSRQSPAPASSESPARMGASVRLSLFSPRGRQTATTDFGPSDDNNATEDFIPISRLAIDDSTTSTLADASSPSSASAQQEPPASAGSSARVLHGETVDTAIVICDESDKTGSIVASSSSSASAQPELPAGIGTGTREADGKTAGTAIVLYDDNDAVGAGESTA